MAIAFDAVSESAVVAAASVTWSHTCTGADRILVVASVFRDDAGISDISSVTYNGVALTVIRRDNTSSLSHPAQSELWYLVAPATGANNIVITFGSTIDNLAAGTGISLTGVDQAHPLDANNGAVGTAGNNDPTVNLTTIRDNAWIIDFAYHADDDGCDVGAGQTSRTDRLLTTGGSTDWMGVSTMGPKTPAGSETMNWTGGVDEFWCISSASFQPSMKIPRVMRQYRQRRV